MCLLLFAPKANFAQEHLWESSDAGQSPPCAPGATRAPQGRAQQQAEGNWGQAEHPAARRRAGWVGARVGGHPAEQPCNAVPLSTLWGQAEPWHGCHHPAPSPKSWGLPHTGAGSEHRARHPRHLQHPPQRCLCPGPSRNTRALGAGGGAHCGTAPGGKGSTLPVGTPGDGREPGTAPRGSQRGSTGSGCAKGAAPSGTAPLRPSGTLPARAPTGPGLLRRAPTARHGSARQGTAWQSSARLGSTRSRIPGPCRVGFGGFLLPPSPPGLQLGQ